jgi:transcriptional regulator with XRE-family HTH domain
MSFGEVIKSARRRQNWTQAQLAAKLSCTKTAVCKWELNKSIPPLTRFNDLADALGILPDVLIGSLDCSARQPSEEIKIDLLLMKIWQRLSTQQRTKLVQIAEIISR